MEWLWRSYSISYFNYHKNKGVSKSIIEYKFKHVRYGSIVDRGSFYILTQSELNQLINDLEGAIEKSTIEGFEWSRSNYTLKSGGNNSPQKAHLKFG